MQDNAGQYRIIQDNTGQYKTIQDNAADRIQKHNHLFRQNFHRLNGAYHVSLTRQ